MTIKSLEIENYRLFRKIKLDNLPGLAVVVGANGSGKSTLFDVFSFFKDSLTQNVSAAVARRGGYRELVSRNSEGPIKLILQFRESEGRLVTYRLVIGMQEGRVVVEREVLRYRRGQRGRPWHLVDFRYGAGQAITNEADCGQKDAIERRQDYELDEPSSLAIKGLGQFRKFRIASELRRLIESWHISDFQIAEARPSADAGYAEHLSTRGDNVALVAQYLFERHRDRFDQILETMRRRVPGIRHVEAKPMEDGRLGLRFQDGSFKDPFMARYVSDGTVKMFAYLILLYDPNPHRLLAVKEPENQLYPHLLPELTEEFRNYAQRGSQVFVSTHSPDFLNGAELDEVIFLAKRNGFAAAQRVRDLPVLPTLVAVGDLPGALWKQGLFTAVEA